jgi:hypothetical protein
MPGYIDRIRSASIGGQMTSVGGTPDSRISAASAPDTAWRSPEGGQMPPASGPLSPALLKLLERAKIAPPGAGQMLDLGEVDAALCAARIEVSDRLALKSALSDLGLLA